MKHISREFIILDRRQLTEKNEQEHISLKKEKFEQNAFCVINGGYFIFRTHEIKLCSEKNILLRNLDRSGYDRNAKSRPNNWRKNQFEMF